VKNDFNGQRCTPLKLEALLCKYVM